MKKRHIFLQNIGIPLYSETLKTQEEAIKTGKPYKINEWIKDNYGISANKMIDAIIKTGDILQIYEFLYLIVDVQKEFTFYKSLNDLEISNEKLNNLQEVILKSGNAKLIRYCIGFVPGIDLDKYLNALYDTKSLWDISELSEGKDYTNDQEVANPKLLERVKLYDYKKAKEIAEKYAQNGEYFPNSLRDYKEQKDDINLLIYKVIESKSPYLICELANYVEHLPKIEDEEKQTALEELAKAELATGDSMGIYEFLSSVESISLELFVRMVKAIINSAVNRNDLKYLEYTMDFTKYSDKMEKIKDMEKNDIKAMKILNITSYHIIEDAMNRTKRERMIKNIINERRGAER